MQPEIIVSNVNGVLVPMPRNVVVSCMDDELREELHALEWSNEQAFADAYADAHLAKFGKAWMVG